MTYTFKKDDITELLESNCRICCKCGEIVSYIQTDEDIPLQDTCPICKDKGGYLFSFRQFPYEDFEPEQIINKVYEGWNE